MCCKRLIGRVFFPRSVFGDCVEYKYTSHQVHFTSIVSIGDGQETSRRAKRPNRTSEVVRGRRGIGDETPMGRIQRARHRNDRHQSRQVRNHDECENWNKIFRFSCVLICEQYYKITILKVIVFDVIFLIIIKKMK